MHKKASLLQKEWDKLDKREREYIQKRTKKKESGFNQFLEKKVPANLQNTLNTAFSKAFYLVFEKGTAVIEKTYRKEEMQKNYQINEFAAQVKNNKKTLTVFSKKATGAGSVNLAFSGVSGIGLGILGIGIPDIVLFTGLMLKSIYETALHYGFDYEDEKEKKFILLLIKGALSYGDDLKKIDRELNAYMENGVWQEKKELDAYIKDASGCLSGELLYMKFLQGIPIAGAVGGAYDFVYLKQILTYAQLKYRRRFYLKYSKINYS